MESKVKKSKKVRNEDTVMSSPTPTKAGKLAKRKSTETTIVSPGDSAKKRKKAKEKDSSLSWEETVKQTRGLPDGEDVGDVKLPSTPSSTKKKQFEKKKKGPFNVIQKASKKFKKLTAKGETGDKEKKDLKKKSSTGEGSKEGEKTKLEELTFKARKKQRKTQKTNYDLALRSKAIWEKLRKRNVSAEEKKNLCNELHGLVNGKAKELIFAHDTSRVVQCLMKYGEKEHKSALFEELQDDILEMAKSKYAKFFVRKMLKYGSPSQRAHVFKSMYGHVRKLIRHSLAAELVEDAYNNYANAQQRSALVEEFYGPSFALFKDLEVKTLEDIMKAHPEKKDSILANMKETLTSLVDKSICQYSIVHRVFYEYFTYAPEKARVEMIQVVRESVIHMLHTRDGSRVAMQCLWYGTTKDRKLIIKSMKTFVVKVCVEEHGHLVLLAMFDCVDDTKLVKNVILQEMLRSVVEVANDKYGRKVLLYLLTYRNPVHCHPEIAKILQQGDYNPNSKKDSETRRAELLTAVSGELLQYVENNAKEVVLNNATVLLLITIFAHVTGDLTNAMRAVARLAAEPFTAGSEESLHVVEHPGGHVAIKQVILQDKERTTQENKALFSHILLEEVSDRNLKAWASCNRGCFTLATLLDLEDEVVTTRVKKALKTSHKALREMSFKGAEILLNKLQSER